jgi:polyhydroxybutyrate depolymerase
MLAIFIAVAVACPAGDRTIELEQGNRKRAYYLHTPAGLLGDRPLLVFLHGAGGSARRAARAYGWPALADREKVVAVFPDALPARPDKPARLLTNPRYWNDGSHRGPEGHDSIDDVGYLRAVLDDVQARCRIDRARVYLAGFSSGASMTWRAGLELAERFAAIAPVSGHLWLEGAKASRLPPVLFITGKEDPLNPFNGGPARNPWGKATDKPPMIASVRKWLALTGGDEKKSEPMRDSNGVTARRFEGSAGSSLTFVTLEKQGHEWPGKPRLLPKWLTGDNRGDYDATEQIWRFFAGQRRGSE